MKKYSRILIIANLILLLGYFNWSVYQKEQTQSRWPQIIIIFTQKLICALFA